MPKARLKNLENFALWLFGDDKRKPLVPESRAIDQFGKILESKKAVDYLRRTPNPTFAAAFRIAGGDEAEVLEHLERASDEVQEALRTVHRHKKSREIREISNQLAMDVMRLLDVFPDLKSKVISENN